MTAPSLPTKLLMISIALLTRLPASHSFPLRHTAHRIATHLFTSINFNHDPSIRDRATSTILLGRHSALAEVVQRTDSYVSLFGFRPPPSVMGSMCEAVKGGGSVQSFVEVPTVGPAAPRPPHQMSLLSVKNTVTRNNHPLSLHSLSDMVKAKSPKKGTLHVICCVEDKFPCGPLGGVVARAFPLFSKKTTGSGGGDGGETSDNNDEGGDEEEMMVHVSFIDEKGKVIKDQGQIDAAKAAAEGVRLACRLVDTHPEELTTTAFAQECHDLFKDEPTVSIQEIVGDELRTKGYGGIYNVGKGAVEPPRLVVLTYDPQINEEEKGIALIGKGIVYDTGGLAIKSKTGMCGMKSDMGGAAGVLGGFLAAVRLKTPRPIHLLLCLAENAIGPSSLRNDDIITQYSGKTVEINNSDAEGRLVLSDAVAHATKHYDVGLVVDMATLTGAQLIATGKVHSGILANTLELERRAVECGLASGDLCFPLVYAPELLKKEFASKVADMKNSVKDRGNAQSSCAGQFIESHIHPDYSGEWLHIDMAGPAWKADRGTGYGVGLTMALVGAPGFAERRQ